MLFLTVNLASMITLCQLDMISSKLIIRSSNSNIHNSTLARYLHHRLHQKHTMVVLPITLMTNLHCWKVWIAQKWIAFVYNSLYCDILRFWNLR